jgi:hypothetical protein
VISIESGGPLVFSLSSHIPPGAIFKIVSDATGAVILNLAGYAIIFDPVGARAAHRLRLDSAPGTA